MNFLRRHRWLLSWGKNLSLAALLTSGLCGCNRTHESAQKGEGKEKAEAAQTSGVKFKAGKGLLLPEETQKAIGLEIVEVAEEKFAPQISAQAEVYRAGDASTPELALARVKPAAAHQLRVGQSVKVQQSANSESVVGKVVRLDSQTEQFLGQTEVLVEIPDANARYPIGSRLAVTFDLGEAKSVSAVPRSAVLTAAEGPFVYVVNGQHFLRTLIKTGGQNKDWIEVADGLFAGDKIVSRPVETLWMTELRAVKGGGDVD